jgi:hypothetical protein
MASFLGTTPEASMSNRAIAGLAALFMITASSLAYVQAASAGEPTHEVLSDADWKALTDRRIEIVEEPLNNPSGMAQ